MDESEKVENVEEEQTEEVEGEDEDDIQEDVEGYDEGDEEHVEEDDGEGEGEENGEEEEEEDDHEIKDIGDDDEGEEEGDEDGDGEGGEGEVDNVAGGGTDKKAPKPIKSIGNFDAIDDPEIKTLLEKTTIKLYDGSTHVIFSRGPKYSDEKWPINCHICFESGIYNLKSLKAHLKSPRHENILQWRPSDPKYQHMKAFRQPFDDDDQTLTPILIYPGEVITEITPDLIDRIISKDETIPPEFVDLIGLCYAYRVRRFKQDLYECILCRKSVTIGHFKTQKHIDRYIDSHFPKTWKTVRNMMVDGKLGWTVHMLVLQQKHIREVVHKIYKKIEEEKGPRNPRLITFRDFNINRVTYEKQARNKKHYDEKMIKITDEWLTELLQEAHEKLKDTVVKGDKEHEETNRRSRGSRSRDRGRLVGDARKSSTRPRIVENDPKAWDRYRRMIGAILDDLEDLYNRKYRKNLESHPKYKSEWKKFWHNRANDLEREGIDPHTYDFNKEWIPYWQKRLDELHAKEVASEKFVTKRKLNLPYDMGSPSPVRRRRRSSPRRSSPTPRPRPDRRRSRSPNDQRPKRRRGDDGPLTVCGVLRLVSALEENLGSLGPQGVQLLSRAILTEKNNPNPDSLLMENEFYIFFMTAKEKLKGQLLANIVEPRKIDAVNRAVDQISSIIRRYENFRARHNNGRNQQAHVADEGNNQHFNDNGQNNRYPNHQFSGGNRGGVWHSGNYRGDNMGGGGGGNQGMPPQNQNYNQPMPPSMNFGGGQNYPSHGGGNNYNNSMNTPQMGGGGNRQMGGMPPSQYGRMDSNNGGGPSYGSNNGGNYGGGGGNSSGPVGNQYGSYQGKRNFDGNEGFGGTSFRADNQRESSAGIQAPPAPSYGPTRGRAGNTGGGFQNKGGILSGNNLNIPQNVNRMGGGNANRQSGGRPIDFNEGMNRGGNNQMTPNRRMNQSDNQMDSMGGGQQAYGNASGGSRPWSSGYNQSGNSSYKGGHADNSGRGQYTNSGPDYSKKSTEMQSHAMRGGGGGSNWNSGDFSNQGFNNRSNQINPPQLNRNMNIGRY